MITATVRLKGVAPYSQSKHITEPKKSQEKDAEYEERTWRHRIHVSEDGTVFIPPMAFKNALQSAARYLSIKIPGRRGATYTKRFESGVLILDPVKLQVLAKDVEGEWLFVPSDGKVGGGSRVMKCFPWIPEWSCQVVVFIADNAITQDVFETHIEAAGQFIGIGRFRPEKRGYYGRFTVENVTWEETE